VDVVVEFEPGHVPGFAFFDMERELSDLLGRKVDLNTPAFLSRYFRDRVLAEAENQYVAALTRAGSSRAGAPRKGQTDERGADSSAAWGPSE
jgi:hypothetical protein